MSNLPLIAGVGLTGLALLESTTNRAQLQDVSAALTTPREDYVQLILAAKWSASRSNGDFDQPDANGIPIPRTNTIVLDRVVDFWEQRLAPYHPAGVALLPRNVVFSLGAASFVPDVYVNENATNPFTLAFTTIRNVYLAIASRTGDSTAIEDGYTMPVDSFASLGGWGDWLELERDEARLFWDGMQRVAFALDAIETYNPSDWSIFMSSFGDAVNEAPATFAIWVGSAARQVATTATNIALDTAGGLFTGLLASPTFLVGAAALAWYFSSKAVT